MLIEPWGENSLRIRVTKKDDFTPNQDWALAYSKDQAGQADEVTIDTKANTCSIVNGYIKASINEFGWLTVTNAHVR